MSSSSPKPDPCPPTPLLLDGRSTPDPEGGPREAVKEEQKEESRTSVAQENVGRSSSPEPSCSICLGELQNMSYTDSCLHKFCFTCLLEWSRVKPVCPLCKARFKSIIHTIRSDDNYESYELPPQPPAPQAQPGSLQLASFEAFMDREARFHYRTTMTRERIQQRYQELRERTG